MEEVEESALTYRQRLEGYLTTRTKDSTDPCSKGGLRVSTLIVSLLHRPLSSRESKPMISDRLHENLWGASRGVVVGVPGLLQGRKWPLLYLRLLALSARLTLPPVMCLLGIKLHHSGSVELARFSDTERLRWRLFFLCSFILLAAAFRARLTLSRCNWYRLGLGGISS